MQFDFKVTSWQRITVSQEQEEKVLDAIKRGEINTASDVYNFLGDEGDMNVNSETLLETETEMTLEDNGGFSTIEVIGDEGESLFKNGK